MVPKQVGSFDLQHLQWTIFITNMLRTWYMLHHICYVPVCHLVDFGCPLVVSSSLKFINHAYYTLCIHSFLRWDTRDHIIAPCGRVCLCRCQRLAVGVFTSGRRCDMLDMWNRGIRMGWTTFWHILIILITCSLMFIAYSWFALHVFVNTIFRSDPAHVGKHSFKTERLILKIQLWHKATEIYWGTLMLFASTWTLEATTLRETRASWPMCQAGTS